MDGPDRSLVSTLHHASLLGTDDAVLVLDGVVRTLDDERPDAPLDAVRTVLSAHLVAIGAVRQARAGDEATGRLVQRAVDAALELIG